MCAPVGRMLIERTFPVHKWVEVFGWLAVIGLIILVQLLPLPQVRRLAVEILLLGIGTYILLAFHWFLPRSRYAPRLVYATLIVDVLIVALLRLLLADYLPNSELAFVPFIVLAAMVTDWRGILVLVSVAGVADFLPQIWIPSLSRTPLSWMSGLNQLLSMWALGFIGAVAFFLLGYVRRGAAESERAISRVAESERAVRETAERTARRWELLNAVSVKIQNESDPERIYAVIASELAAMQLNGLVTLWDSPDSPLRVAHLSVAPSVRNLLEQVTGISLEQAELDIRDLPNFQQAMEQRRGVLANMSGEVLERVVPNFAGIAGRLVEILGGNCSITSPLLVSDRVIGFCTVWGRDLDASDIPAMTGLGQQLATALEKGPLFERERKRAAQLALVSEIAERAVGLLDAKELLQEVTRLIVLRFGFENASILLNDPMAQEVVLQAHAGHAINPQQVGYRQSWQIGLIGHAARTSTTVLANDVHADPRYHTDDANTDICRAELVIPLKRQAETVGVLDVQSTRVNAFEPGDAIALEALVSILATAIEKGELFSRERKRAAQLAMVGAIAERAASMLDVDHLLNQVVLLICERFGYHYVAVMLLDDTERELVMKASSGAYANIFPRDYRQSVSVGLIGEAIRTGTTIISNDVRLDDRFYFPAGSAPLARSEMCVPLKIGNQPLGIFDVHSLPAKAFDASDIAAMETLANQFAIALENARLYAQTRGDAEVKATLLRELSHRVKNNLASVVGLLYLGLEDEEIPRHQILSETLMRVQSVAVAHALLASSPGARVDIVELGRRVIGDSVRQMTLLGQKIHFRVTGQAIDISAKQASSLALVLNELVTNAIKHGDPEKDMLLSVTRVASRAQLEFCNQGAVLPEEAVDLSTGGLGLQLIRTLVEKDLKGTFMATATGEPLGVVSVICFDPEP